MLMRRFNRGSACGSPGGGQSLKRPQPPSIAYARGKIRRPTAPRIRPAHLQLVWFEPKDPMRRYAAFRSNVYPRGNPRSVDRDRATPVWSGALILHFVAADDKRAMILIRRGVFSLR